MCGISGVIQLGNKINIDHVKQSIHFQKHRGPDGMGFSDMGNVILGHARLSIIDLDERSSQPMYKYGYSLTFNGEIYNYVELKIELEKLGETFHTKSDTEVILSAYHVWGKECVEKFRGMFAFALWDKNKHELFCARDWFGIKPFYYMNLDGAFVFSSEIKGLLPFKKLSPNYSTICGYLENGTYGYEGSTFFDGISELRPSHYMVINERLDQLETRYWDIYAEDKYNEGEIESAKGNYIYDLSCATKLRLKSDVPIGINLSGGLDSSILIDIASRLGFKEHNAYTYTCGELDYDESTVAKTNCDRYGLKWNEVMFFEEEFFANLYNAQWHIEVPFGGLPTLSNAKIFKTAKMNGTSVILCGAGMDEQWAGYDYYDSDFYSANVVQGSKTPLNRSSINKDFRNAYYRYNKIPKKFDSDIDSIKYRDLFYTKIPRGVLFYDRISMMNGVELRVPFLDHKLVMSSFKMPDDFMIRDGWKKWLLRTMFESTINSEILWKRKQSIQTPMREWICRSKWAEDMIESNQLHKDGICNKKNMLIEWDKLKKGSTDGFFIWQWINMDIWFKSLIN